MAIGADFTTNFEFRLHELILDVNFTRDFDGKMKLTVLPKTFFWNYMKSIKISEFILAQGNFSINVTGSRYDSPWLIKLSRISGNCLNLIVEILGWGSLALTIVMIFFDIDITRPFLDFLRMVKPVTRFKYINIYYGGIIEIFLWNFKNVFHIISDTRTDENEQYFLDSRSSLRRFYLPVLAFTSIPDKYLLYLVLCLLKVLQVKLYHYARGRRNLTSDDETLVDLIDKVKLPLFFFLIYDVIFYTSHTLVHQSLIVHQNRNAIFSFALAMVMLMMFTYEFIVLILKNKHFVALTKTQVLEDLIAYSIKQAHIALPNLAVPKLLKRFKKWSGAQVNNMFIAFEQRVSSKSAEIRFFEAEIKNGDLTKSFVHKYYNLISVLKVMMMEPLYITLQMNKSFQILSLLLIQLSFIAFVLYAAFVKRIFTNWWNYTFNIIHELALGCYFATGFFFYLKGESRFLTSQGFDNVQLMLVLYLMIAVSCGVIKLVVSQTIILIKKCSGKRSDYKEKLEVDSN